MNKNSSEQKNKQLIENFKRKHVFPNSKLSYVQKELICNYQTRWLIYTNCFALCPGTSLDCDI